MDAGVAMRWLAFDTSSTSASVALWEEGDCVAEVTAQLGRRHSEALFSIFDHVLSLSGWTRDSLGGIAIGVGPGSFTGLRVGVATAQGLAFALSCPLVGVPSMDALAASGPPGASTIVTCLDARKKEVYTNLYKLPEVSEGRLPMIAPVYPARLLTPAALCEELEALEGPIVMLGSGAFAYESLFREALKERLLLPAHRGYHVVQASHIAALAAAHFDASEQIPPFEVLPLYIRPSEAEMNQGPPEGGPPLSGRLMPDGTILPASEAKPRSEP